MTGNSLLPAGSEPNKNNKTMESEAPTESAETTETTEPAEATIAGADLPALLDAHKGKLAVGVAATLGLMIYYNLKKKKLPEEDPEGYARLQKLKDSLRAETAKKHGDSHSHAKPRKDRGRNGASSAADGGALPHTGATNTDTGT